MTETPTIPRPGSRAARLMLPRTVEVVRELAAEYGVCARPVPLRRTDLDTGRTEVIDLPCGATRDDKCPACAKRARKLRQQQIREGWHRTDEPVPGPLPATEEQRGLLVVRAHLEFFRAEAITRADWDEVQRCDDAITEVDGEIAASGLRGRAATPHAQEASDPAPVRRKRSTKRRDDVAELPRLPVDSRTVGRRYVAPDGKVFQPSLFLTLTLDTYGRVLDDGTPVNPATYDYRRAAWDAIHFPALLDRLWQNLRRAVGWNVQYAGAVEPQRRLAPHAHFAIRGTMPRALVRQVVAATYHQVWWPPVVARYEATKPPRWDADRKSYVDPTTSEPLPTWDQALDALDDDPYGEPVHVVRFGRQVHIDGVLANSRDSERCIGYITKYLTKSAADCHKPETDRQRAHLERLWTELRFTPCSERCPNWLLYGVQPKNARPGQRPGGCKGRAHSRATLGIGGRRVLVSRQWSGKTLADHKADKRAWVRGLLAVTVDGDDAGPEQPASRYAWELARKDDRDVPPLDQRLLRSISERIHLRSRIDAARAGANAPPQVSATGPSAATAADVEGSTGEPCSSIRSSASARRGSLTRRPHRRGPSVRACRVHGEGSRPAPSPVGRRHLHARA